MRLLAHVLINDFLWRPLNAPVANVFVDLLGVHALEGYRAVEAAEQYIAHSPRVNGDALGQAVDDFGRHVVDGANEGVATIQVGPFGKALVIVELNRLLFIFV